MLHKVLRPDSKGRITLGAITQGISSYILTETEDHKLILEPQVEIPAREKWLFDNQVALDKVKQGIQDAAEGKLTSKGSFSQYADDDIE